MLAAFDLHSLGKRGQKYKDLFSQGLKTFVEMIRSESRYHQSHMKECREVFYLWQTLPNFANICHPEFVDEHEWNDLRGYLVIYESLVNNLLDLLMRLRDEGDKRERNSARIRIVFRSYYLFERLRFNTRATGARQGGVDSTGLIEALIGNDLTPQELSDVFVIGSDLYTEVLADILGKTSSYLKVLIAIKGVLPAQL